MGRRGRALGEEPLNQPLCTPDGWGYERAMRLLSLPPRMPLLCLLGLVGFTITVCEIISQVQSLDVGAEFYQWLVNQLLQTNNGVGVLHLLSIDFLSRLQELCAATMSNVTVTFGFHLRASIGFHCKYYKCCVAVPCNLLLLLLFCLAGVCCVMQSSVIKNISAVLLFLAMFFFALVLPCNAPAVSCKALIENKVAVLLCLAMCFFAVLFCLARWLLCHAKLCCSFTLNQNAGFSVQSST